MRVDENQVQIDNNPIAPSLLYDISVCLPNLKRLKINGNLSCNMSSQSIRFNTNVTFENLDHFEFSNFSECLEFHAYLAKNVFTSHLDTIVYKNCVVNEDNIKSIKKFVKQAKFVHFLGYQYVSIKSRLCDRLQMNTIHDDPAKDVISCKVYA